MWVQVNRTADAAVIFVNPDDAEFAAAGTVARELDSSETAVRRWVTKARLSSS